MKEYDMIELKNDVAQVVDDKKIKKSSMTKEDLVLLKISRKIKLCDDLIKEGQANKQQLCSSLKKLESSLIKHLMIMLLITIVVVAFMNLFPLSFIQKLIFILPIVLTCSCFILNDYLLDTLKIDVKKKLLKELNDDLDNVNQKNNELKKEYNYHKKKVNQLEKNDSELSEEVIKKDLEYSEAVFMGPLFQQLYLPHYFVEEPIEEQCCKVKKLRKKY